MNPSGFLEPPFLWLLFSQTSLPLPPSWSLRCTGNYPKGKHRRQDLGGSGDLGTPFLLEADQVLAHGRCQRLWQTGVQASFLLLYPQFFCLQVGDPHRESHPGPHLHIPVGWATLALGSGHLPPVDSVAAGASVRSVASSAPAGLGSGFEQARRTPTQSLPSQTRPYLYRM